MNNKQRKFVAEYLKDQNGTQAAIRAGYSKKTSNEQAVRLLANISVKEAVESALQKATEKAIVDRAYILSSLKEIAERCMQRVPVMIFDKEEKTLRQAVDEDTGEGIWEFDSSGANRALELLGKSLQMFTDKVEHTGKDGSPLTVQIVSYK